MRGLGAAALLLLSCSQQVPASSDAGAPTASASATASSSGQEQLPVPADFEDAADREIDANNYREKLDEIVTELGGKPAAPLDAGADAAVVDAGVADPP